MSKNGSCWIDPQTDARRRNSWIFKGKLAMSSIDTVTREHFERYALDLHA